MSLECRLPFVSFIPAGGGGGVSPPYQSFGNKKNLKIKANAWGK